MPIYMDIHIIPGVRARDVAEAHSKDLFHQGEYGCKCMTYWVDEARENVFCLMEAPDRKSVEDLHSNAHGLVPNKIIEVSTTLVESFLGRIYDPNEAQVTDDGLKVFSDPSFRVLVVTRITDPVLLQSKLGKEKANELLNRHYSIVRKNLAQFGGREVEHGGSGFIISFVSAAKAVSCALAIQKEMPLSDVEAIGFKMGINAGEPVESSNRLFGDTIYLANCLSAISGNNQVAISSSVKELIAKDNIQNGTNNFFSIAPQDEQVLVTIFNKLEENCQDPEFDIQESCQALAMSQSQLYRKTTALTGLSCNQLLKEIRLEKAKELMRKQRYTVTQVTFDSGFTSPSYFTKCFKKKYGLLPMEYIDLLH